MHCTPHCLVLVRRRGHDAQIDATTAAICSWVVKLRGQRLPGGTVDLLGPCDSRQFADAQTQMVECRRVGVAAALLLLVHLDELVAEGLSCTTKRQVVLDVHGPAKEEEEGGWG